MSTKPLSGSNKIDFLSDYNIKGIIGKGTFSVVKLGEHKKTKEKVAIKIMQKNKILSKDDLIRIEREIEILKRLNHPNVIKIHKIYDDEKKFYIIMEFCENGELFNRIVEKRYLTEDEAALFYYQLINGLEYIHKNNIVHRDLKPENLLLSKTDLLKIIDFGLSNYTGSDILLGTPCGSPCYASPEMVSGQRYNGYMIDVWSTGIILFAMVCGYLPFEDNDNEILFAKILKCKIHYPKSMGSLTLDLMKKIITPDPKKRITLEQIKKHPFYLKGKDLFNKKFPELINEINKNEISNNPIKEIIINNVTPIVKSDVLKNIKENKGKNNDINSKKYYPLNISEINNLYHSYKTETNKENVIPTNINNSQEYKNINIVKPIPNIKSEEKENIINKDYKLESPSSLRSDEIPQDSVPVELSEGRNKIKNIQVKLDLKKNLKEEMNTINNSVQNKNIKNTKVYKINAKMPKDKEILYLSTKNRTIEKDRKKMNNPNYITATSQINERIIVDLYDNEKLNSTLDNTSSNNTRAIKMDYYNLNDNQSKNKYTKINYKFDKNAQLNNQQNNKIYNDKNNIYIKDIKDNYFTNNKPNQNYDKFVKITKTFSKRIQRKPIYGINKINVRKDKTNAENNMNLTNVNPELMNITARLNSYTYDEKVGNDILKEKNKKQNINEIFNEFHLINNNTNTINIDIDRNIPMNKYNNKTNIIERNIEKPLMIGKTVTQIPRKDIINNKKEMYRLNNYANNKDNINLNSDRNYHLAVKSKNLSMTHRSENRKIVSPMPNAPNKNNIYLSNNLANFKGVSPINDKYFDTITINNNNSINLHEPKLYIYLQNNNTNNITDYQRMKTESNPNKTKMIFKYENQNNINVKNANKINSVEYNKIIPAKRINTNLIENKTIENDMNIKQRYKVTPIKNNNTMINNNKDTKKNDKFIISKKIYNSIVPNNKKMYTFKTTDIIFNNSKKSKDNNIKYISSKNNNNNYYFDKNFYNNPITKSLNNNTITQVSNISKSLDKSNYPYPNHNIVKTDGNIDLWSYDNLKYLNSNNIIVNNYVNNNNQRFLRKDDYNYTSNKNNYENNDYKMKIHNLQLKNYVVNNKNMKYVPQTMNDANILDSFNNYRRINTITTDSIRTPDNKQNHKNMMNYKQYVKHY